jgi:mRNA-degrading endonuclease RelE of RelBE toxin-antitoxin system
VTVWSVRLSSEARKVFERADRPTKSRIVEKLKSVALDPFTASKPLVNSDMRSARVGGLRILLKLDHGEVVVLVISIEPRGQVYRRLS